MKPMVFLAIVLLAVPAFAQDKPAPAPDTAKPEATKPEAVKEPVQPAEALKPAPTRSAASRKAGRRWNEDARHCLEKATNTEVIKCAEEYL